MAAAGNTGIVENILSLISEMTFFDSFETQELDIISRQLTIREVDKDEVVFSEGEKGNYMCFIASGLLNIVKDIDGKKNVVISSVNKGKSLGEMAMVDLSPRSATVIGAKASTLVIMSREAFDLILERHPKIGVKLLSGVARLLSLHLRQASGRLADYIATN